MINAHLLLPSDITSRLSKTYPMAHKDGCFGYFADLSIGEFWSIVRSLVDSGYRVDITPGNSYKLMARKEG